MKYYEVRIIFKDTGAVREIIFDDKESADNEIKNCKSYYGKSVSVELHSLR